MRDFESFTGNEDPREYGVLPRSVHRAGDALVYLARKDGKEFLVIKRNGAAETLPEDHRAAALLREAFPFTAPSRVLGERCTIGVGDRLGLACSGHLRVFEKYDAYPVLAQQSIRELTLTGRSFNDVLDCVTFAVFREDFQKKWGADGDHLKQFYEIEYALGCGYTMITLDCSEKIFGGAAHMTAGEVAAAYTPQPEMESAYLGRSFDLGGGLEITFDETELKRSSLIYGKAIGFIDEVYRRYIENNPNVDFEISIDETETPTTPHQHFFVANELRRRGIKIQTMAPRFCGEFQKGIDYIGDLDQFDREMKTHCAIADHFGYKISVHSGSDKFSAFPSIGRNTRGHLHLKTAGTNWLEAAKLVAMKDPSLYREMHKFALRAFPEAQKYYHVTTDLTKIPDVDKLSDSELPVLFNNNDSRQLIHITYGLILGAKDGAGCPLFYDRLYALWAEYADEYSDLIFEHIGKHLEMLFSGVAAGRS